jgi:parallel beta-helix repeat protein/predicted outer membrane repeat protein
MCNISSSSPTVTNCTFSSNTATWGGGMYNEDASNPTVNNCTFSGNTADQYGGGMYNYNSSTTVTNCTFSGNSASEGGGGMCNENTENLFEDFGCVSVTNCTFNGNTAYWGGGMYNYYLFQCSTVNNCTFSGNSATHNGGGMYNDDSSTKVNNCTFSGNTANNAGGGGMRNYNSNPIVTNCTFSGNTANNDYAGGGMDNDYNSNINVTNCIFWGNSPDEIFTAGSSWITFFHSDVQGGLPAWGEDDGGNISVDPLFVDADGPDNTAGTGDDNLRLSGGSLCIDSGNGFIAGFPFDLDGNQRIVDDPATTDTGVGFPEVVDMGAYEFGSSPAPCISQLEGDINCDGIVNLLDLSLLALHWLETI